MTEETATATTRQRRKRKWDQPAEAVVSAAGMSGLLPFTAGALAGMGALPGVFPPYMNYFPAMSATAAQITPAATVQQNAAAIVQKFNQDLASKGLLLQAKIQDELIAREITINDADPGVRYKLTKRQTQEEIQLKTGAVVITRGRYRPPNGPVEPEKPLYLHISAGVNLKDTAERIKAVDQAAAMVEEMLKQGQHTQVPLRSSSVATVSTGNVPTSLTLNIFVGIEADPSFNLSGRIRGPNDQYINHIMNETGATVVLRGKGSDYKEVSSGVEAPQPLHLLISSDNPKSLEDAKTLAENLLETIHADSLRFRLPPFQVLPSAVPSVPSPALMTYPTPQQMPYQASVANLPQNPYGSYYPPAGGAYPPPHTAIQTPVPSFTQTSSISSVGQPATADTPTTNPYSNMIPPAKVYGAVPPPVQLLGDQSIEKPGQGAEGSPDKKPQGRIRERFSQSSANDTSAPAPGTVPVPSFTTSHPQPSTSHAVYTPTPRPYVTTSQFLQQHHSGIAAAPGSASQPPQTSKLLMPGQSVLPVSSQTVGSNHVQAPVTSSYNGYNGVYTEVSSSQQVTQALQRPPLPVSVKPQPTSAFLASLTKAQSSSFQEKYSDKPAQRRKFQEYPVGGKDSSADDQQQGWRGTSQSVPDASTSSQETGPAAFSRSMPPSPPRGMPPPPPKSMPPPKFFSSAVPARVSSPLPVQPKASLLSASAGSSKQLNDHAARPGTGLKLVEYGEEEEESSAGLVPISASKPFSNGKPFWAA